MQKRLAQKPHLQKKFRYFWFMKLVKKVGIVLVSLLLVGHVLLLLTGNTHLYKALPLTVFKGKMQPSIDDYKHFDNREIKTGLYQPWAVGNHYNKKSLSKEATTYMQSLGTVAFLMIKNDSIVYENYWDGYSDSSLSNSFSMAKSVVSVLIGCAIGDGLIKNVDEPAVNYLPDYKDVIGDKITIKHLLTMSTGIDFDESYGNPFGMMAKAYYGHNLKKIIKKYHPSSPPGKEFNYLGGNTLLLGFIVEKVTGKKLADYASQKLWQPMGAKNPALWTTDMPNGDERSYCCYYSNAQDFARLGKLYLDSGRWKGKQLVPQEYVLQSIVPDTGIKDGGKPNQIYGYQWWCLQYKGQQLFYARGIKGQYIIVNPTEKTIIVRLGHQRAHEQEDGHPTDVFKYLQIADGL